MNETKAKLPTKQWSTSLDNSARRKISNACLFVQITAMPVCIATATGNTSKWIWTIATIILGLKLFNDKKA